MPTPDSEQPRRLRVVGNAGAGKTTFAIALASRLGLAHLELDEVFWDANWTLRDPDEARTLLADFLGGAGRDGWVIDGNWNRKLDGTLDNADRIVWLDYPRRVILPRVLRRTISRGITGRPTWHGNTERLSNLLRRDPEQNIVLWSWSQHAAYRERYRQLAAGGAPVLQLDGPRAARRWLESLPLVDTGSSRGES